MWSNYVDPWISDSPPTPGVSIRQRPRLVPGGVSERDAGWATRIPLHWLQVIHPAASRVTRTDVAVRGPDNLGHGRTVLQWFKVGNSARKYQMLSWFACNQVRFLEVLGFLWVFSKDNNLLKGKRCVTPRRRPWSQELVTDGQKQRCGHHQAAGLGW